MPINITGLFTPSGGAGAFPLYTWHDCDNHNWNANTAPGIDNDINDYAVVTGGYVVGSVWIDTTADKAYICLDNTNHAAVWTEITVTTGGSGTAGAMGPPGLDGQDGADGWPIPGPKGDTGSAGSAGAAGISIPGMDGEDGADGWSIPGPVGASGATGATGIGLMGPPGMDGADGADGWSIPGPQGAAGAAGGGMDSDDVTYAPTTAADWDGAADPGDVEQALDQLADRLADGRLWVPASAMWPTTDNGCAWPARRESANSRTNVFYCAFDPATDEYAEFTIVLPLWDQSTIDVSYYWTTAAAAGTTVVWGIAAQSLANDDSLDTAYAAATYADADTVLAAHDVHIIADTGITVAGAGAGELIMCRVTRDPDADTCASDADLLGVVITYGRRDA
jgi:hypothetical protein